MRLKLLIIGFLTTNSVFAQESMHLSFREAVNIGLKNNVTLKQEENNLIAAKSNQTTSVINYAAPRINLSGNYGTNNGNSFNQQEGKVVNGQLDFLSTQATASFTIFSGLSRFHRMRQTKNQQDAQLYNIKWTRETVINDVAIMYLNVLLNQELLKIAENNLELQMTQLNKIEEQVSIGSLAEVEKVNQEYQVKNAELELIRAKSRKRLSIANMLQYLQLPPTIELSIAEPTWTNKVIVDENQDIQELLKTAMENRADLKQTRAFEEAASSGIKAIKGLYYPTLALFYSYQSAYNYVYGIPNNREFDQQFFEDNIQKTYGLTVSVPILNGFTTRNQVVQSKVAYENAQLAIDKIYNDIKTDILNAYQGYSEALASYEASKLQLDAAKLSFELEKERFNLGASDFIQYTLANQNLVNAQADYAQAYYTLIFQDVVLSYATGTLSVDDIP